MCIQIAFYIKHIIAKLYNKMPQGAVIRTQPASTFLHPVYNTLSHLHSQVCFSFCPSNLRGSTTGLARYKHPASCMVPCMHVYASC